MASRDPIHKQTEPDGVEVIVTARPVGGSSGDLGSSVLCAIARFEGMKLAEYDQPVSSNIKAKPDPTVVRQLVLRALKAARAKIANF